MSNVLRYAIIRHYPWSERDEFVNVGVIIESSSGVVYRLLEPRNYSFKIVMERNELEELWEVFESSLFRARRFNLDKAQRESRIPRSLSMSIERYFAELPSELQCSDIRTIFLERDDPHLILEYLNSLFDRQVVRHVKQPRKRPLEPGRLLKRRLRSDLTHWQVLDKLLPAQDLVITIPWPMDFIYCPNGSETGIRVLDCGVKGISEVIRVAYGAARDIEETRRANISVIAVTGNQKQNPDAFSLTNRVLGNREPALRLVNYDTDQGKDELRRRLQDGISRRLLIP